MKRIFSKCLTMAAFFLLALAPVFTATAQAASDDFMIGATPYATLQDAVDAVTAGQTILMRRNVSLSDVVYFDNNINAYTLDLGGNTLSTTGQPDTALNLGLGTVTIKNGSISADTATSAIYVSGASVTLDGLTVTNVYPSSMSVVNLYTGTLSILSGTYSGAGSTVFVSGGAASLLSGDYSSDVVPVEVHAGTLSISGGNYVGASDAVFVTGGTVTLTAGYFKSTVNPSNGCLYRTGGSIVLASGSTATVNSIPLTDNWLNKATEVTVTVSAASTNADLSALAYRVNGGAATPVPSFSAGQTTYDITLPVGTSPTASISIAATAAAGAGATISAPDINLSGGAGTATAMVTAPNGTTTKTYTLNFSTMMTPTVSLVGASPSGTQGAFAGNLNVTFAVSGSASENLDFTCAIGTLTTVVPNTGDGQVSFFFSAADLNTLVAGNYPITVSSPGSTHNSAITTTQIGTLTVNPAGGGMSSPSVSLVGASPSGTQGAFGGLTVSFAVSGSASESLDFTCAIDALTSTTTRTGDGQASCVFAAAGLNALAASSYNITVSSPGSAHNNPMAATTIGTLTVLSGGGGIIPPPPGPTPTPTPAPTPSSGNFSDGDTLAAGGSYVAPAGNSGFCLGGNPGSAPVAVIIDDVPYMISPEAEDTCFEVFAAETGRALILDSGTADISTPMPGAALLEARNGDLVINEGNATIRVTVDPVCTSTRITVLEGKVDAPEWITSPMPASGCPEDALTPGQKSFMVHDGKLACPPAALTIKGGWSRLTVQQTQPLAAGQQLFVVAGHPLYGWYQNNGQGWMPLGDAFLPFSTASQTGPTTTTSVERLDVRPIIGTELYTGNGTSAEEMMMNGRYCGAFKVAP
ncbi:MAG: hypothetical protein FWD77_07510 [Betaproteobacteria bacterium]|nr:hypothetical protein [Betaproteobacteria bacterium]